MLALIRQRGHQAIGLPEFALRDATLRREPMGEPTHAAWLGVDWQTDALQTRMALGARTPDWLIVDHYALDARWESNVSQRCHRLMAIDDLADRAHACNVLLDQNLVIAMEQRYCDKVPAYCTCLIGPQYALLRPEFRALRQASLARRKAPVLERLLVSMGGTDDTNETAKVIAGVQLAKRHWQHIDVVVGQDYPAAQQLRESLVAIPTAELHIQTRQMASLMEAADLAITACGSVTWEKCTLGLPSIGVILGENQRPIATMLQQLGAQRILGAGPDVTPAMYADTLDATQVDELSAMIDSASAICDGGGAQKVSTILEHYA